MTESPARSSTPAAAFFYVWSVTVGLALLEVLLWRLGGRDDDVAAVLSFAFGVGVLATALVWLGSRRIGRPNAQTATLTIVILPYTFHLSAKTGISAALENPAAGFVALAVAMVLTHLSDFAPIRVMVHGWVAVGALLLATTHTTDVDRPPLVAPETYPDVVLIVMDTTRRDHLSLYGYDRPTTPALERFAVRAQIYEDAWSTAPWTPSSHASMFTGLLPAEHGVDGVQLPPFPAEIESLPEILESAGFHTAGFIANPNLMGRGWDRGFESYSPAWFEGSHTLVPVLNWFLMGGAPVWLDNASSDRVLDSARRWWAANDDAPRFLFLNLIDPHDPYRPPEMERRRFLPALSRAESFAIQQDPRHYAVERGLSDEARQVVTALYDAEIAALDRRLGEFFEWMTRRGDLDDSLIVVTADHGERLGEQGMLGHLLLMDQHLLRVPLIIRYPSRLESGRIADRVQLNGMPGEILDLLEIEATPVFSERSLSAQLNGSPGQAESPDYAIAQHRYFGWYVSQLRSREPVFDESKYLGSWTLVADREHALLWSPTRPDEAGRMVVLDGDPDWRLDLWDSQPETRERLLELARAAPQFIERVESGLSDPRENQINAILRERLRALGYVE